jgi:hypothetical protein
MLLLVVVIDATILVAISVILLIKKVLCVGVLSSTEVL